MKKRLKSRPAPVVVCLFIFSLPMTTMTTVAVTLRSLLDACASECRMTVIFHRVTRAVTRTKGGMESTKKSIALSKWRLSASDPTTLHTHPRRPPLCCCASRCRRSRMSTCGASDSYDRANPVLCALAAPSRHIRLSTDLKWERDSICLRLFLAILLC